MRCCMNTSRLQGWKPGYKQGNQGKTEKRPTRGHIHTAVWSCTVISMGIQGEETSWTFSTSGLCRGVRAKVSVLNLWGAAPLEAEWPFHWHMSDIPACQIVTLGFVTVAPLQLGSSNGIILQLECRHGMRSCTKVLKR